MRSRNSLSSRGSPRRRRAPSLPRAESLRFRAGGTARGQEGGPIREARRRGRRAGPDRGDGLRKEDMGPPSRRSIAERPAAARGRGHRGKSESFPAPDFRLPIAPCSGKLRRVVAPVAATRSTEGASPRASCQDRCGTGEGRPGVAVGQTARTSRVRSAFRPPHEAAGVPAHEKALRALALGVPGTGRGLRKSVVRRARFVLSARRGIGPQWLRARSRRAPAGRSSHRPPHSAPSDLLAR